MKEEKRIKKHKKHNWVPKPKSENERLDAVCGQPAW